MVMGPMSRDKLLRRSIFTLIVLISFSYGTLAGQYRLFPFGQMRATVKYISDLKTRQEESSRVTVDYTVDSSGEYLISPFIEYNIEEFGYNLDITLNNFDVYRNDFTELDEIDRLAYLDFKNGLLSVYSQDDYSILANTGIDRFEFKRGVEANGGIRNIFFYKDNLLALVGLRNMKTECAYASLINISLKIVVLEFPCLPQFELVTLNTLGGGFVSMPDSEALLLALGTPEWLGPEIRALAQIPGSPYGKILKIPESTILGNGNSYSIYSAGVRNPQSMLSNGEKIIAVEHGPRGGDEINLIEEGSNYGWPIVSLGSHYYFEYIAKTGRGDNKTNKDLTDPLFSFIPAIAPSMVSQCPRNYEEYYQPNRCILIGSLKARSLFFVQIDDRYSRVVAIEQYEHGSRIRKLIVDGDDIIVGTDYGYDDDYTVISFLQLRLPPSES